MALFGGAFGSFFIGTALLCPLNYTKKEFPVKMVSAILASSTLSDFSFIQHWFGKVHSTFLSNPILIFDILKSNKLLSYVPGCAPFKFCIDDNKIYWPSNSFHSHCFHDNHYKNNVSPLLWFSLEEEALTMPLLRNDLTVFMIIISCWNLVFCTS